MNHNAVPLQALRPLWLALFAVSPALAAAQATAPNAGSILQQITPVQPAAPSATGTGLKVLEEGTASLPPSAPFLVQKLQITGNTLFDTASLHALVADGEGKELILPQLGELVGRITRHYQSNGYPLARAIIPAQVIKAGIVRIEVIEARYGRVRFDNSSQASTSLLQATLASLQGGDVIAQAEMDRSLLLLSDIPGVVIAATLKPGEAVGSSDMLVNATPGPRITGNLVLDNNGNRYTGRARAGGTLHINNPMQHGDILNVSALTSGSGLNYGRLVYESVLNGQGTRLGGSYSALDYELGDTLAPLNAHGNARTASLWAKHPFIRSRSVNLYGEMQYDQLRLRDRVDATGIRTDRHLDNWTISLIGDLRDGLLAGGVNIWNLRWTTGRVAFDDALALATDAATARSAGSFSKWQASFARLQTLGAQDALYLVISGQAANTNLDSSQKMSVGGPYSVRAYDIGALSGDTGYQATVELRHDLGQNWGGQWQAVAFVDSARLRVNQTTWGGGTNSATLSGAGLGLSWLGPQGVSVRAHVAAPIGSTPALLGTTNSVRAWMEIVKAI